MSVREKDGIDHLFRYRAINEKTLNALKEGKLYFSTPAFFNDPFDSLLFVDKDKLIRSINRDIEKGISDGYFDTIVDRLNIPESMFPSKELMSKFIVNLAKSRYDRETWLDTIIDGIEQVRKNIVENSKVICFSEKCASILMWSHYGDYHKGFVLMYSKESIEKAKAYNSKGEEVRFRPYLKPVTYCEQLPDSGELYYQEIPKLRDNNGEWPLTFGINHLYNKMNIWSYESEWRLCSQRNTFAYEDELQYLMIEPEAIILGAKISDENRKKLVSIAKKKHIVVAELCTSFEDNRFHLSIKGS